jgi:hypothetical protein
MSPESSKHVDGRILKEVLYSFWYHSVDINN